jgi:toxin ParE1/3/4
MARDAWIVRLGEDAEHDLASISAWTAERFGARQAELYADAISRAIGEIAAHPLGGRSKARDQDIGAGYRTLHVAKTGRRARHLCLYRCDEKNGLIMIVRILHDSMDLSIHLPPPDVAS